MAEAKDPRRDAPFALFAALLTTAALYCLIQYVVVTVIPSASATDRPLSLAAQAMWGKWGASLITTGALISVYGFLSAHMLNAPRLSFALGEHRDFPSLFSRIHPRFRHISILIFAGVVGGLAVFGNFKWNVLVSAVARLFVYILVCAAPLLIEGASARGGGCLQSARRVFVAGLGIALMLILVSRMRLDEWAIILATMTIALANWLWVRKQNGVILRAPVEP